MGDKNEYSFSLDELSEHIEYFKSQGFTFVSVRDLLNWRVYGSRNILISIDDGHRTVYEAYRDVLRPNNIKPLLGIYPAIIGKKKYALTWEEVRDLANKGCDIASHGFYHSKVNQKLFDSNKKGFLKEIVHSKKILEEKLEREVDIFIYPFGIVSDLVIEYVKGAGYRYAFSIHRNSLDPVELKVIPYELPRYLTSRVSWKGNFNSIIRNAKKSENHKIASRKAVQSNYTSDYDIDFIPRDNEIRIREEIKNYNSKGASSPVPAGGRGKDLPKPGISPQAEPITTQDTTNKPKPGGSEPAKIEKYELKEFASLNPMVPGEKKIGEIQKNLKNFVDLHTLKDRYIVFTNRSFEAYRNFFTFFEGKLKMTGDKVISIFWKKNNK
jgi:peptidoglycan/xylan/chitin deacetylase (PgdA/CDA1 family)